MTSKPLAEPVTSFSLASDDVLYVVEVPEQEIEPAAPALVTK